MNDTQKVTVELTRTGKFKLTGQTKTDELNPKALVLLAAAKCAGITVMRLLAKEKITPKSFQISVEGVLDTPTVQPGSHFRSFNVAYDVECKTISEQTTVSHAVTMTQEKYCGTIDMLRSIAPVAHEIAIVSTESLKV